MPLLTFSGRERLRHPESICPIGRRVESDLALHAIAGVTQEGGRKSVQAQLIAPQRFRKCCSDPDFHFPDPDFPHQPESGARSGFAGNCRGNAGKWKELCSGATYR